MELEELEQTKSEKLKEWSKMTTGATFYCSGVSEDNKYYLYDNKYDEYDDYGYVAKVIGTDDDGWACEDIWNRHDEHTSAHEWVAQKATFMTHDVFKIINPSDYPEYFL